MSIDVAELSQYDHWRHHSACPMLDATRLSAVASSPVGDQLDATNDSKKTQRKLSAMFKWVP